MATTSTKSAKATKAKATTPEASTTIKNEDAPISATTPAEPISSDTTVPAPVETQEEFTDAAVRVYKAKNYKLQYDLARDIEYSIGHDQELNNKSDVFIVGTEEELAALKLKQGDTIHGVRVVLALSEEELAKSEYELEEDK